MVTATMAEGYSQPIQLYDMACHSSLRGCGMIHAEQRCPGCGELHPLLLMYRPVRDFQCSPSLHNDSP